MAINRNFIVKQGADIGQNANAGSTWTSNRYWSNKTDIQQVPAISLDFSRGQIDARIKTIRSSNSTVVTANGKMAYISANTPRIEYDTVNIGYCHGLVSEEQRTNSLFYSDIEGAIGSVPIGMADPYPGTNSSPQVTTEQWVGPNRQSAKHYRTAPNDDNVGYFGTSGALTLNKWYTASIYVYIPTSSPATRVYMSIDAGLLTWGPTVLTYVDADMTIRDRWQRLAQSVYATAGVSGAGIILRAAAPLATGVPVVYSDAWQFEMGEYASTYIYNYNSTATRSDDWNYAEFASSHRPTAFSMMVEGKPKWTANTLYATIQSTYNYAPTDRGLCCLINGNADNGNGWPYNGYGITAYHANLTGATIVESRWLRSLGNGFVQSADNGGNGPANTGINFLTYVANTIVKVAASIDSTGSASATRIAVNGNVYSQGYGIYSPTLDGVNWIVLGRKHVSGDNTIWGGHIRKFQYFPKSLTSTELLALTEK